LEQIHIYALGLCEPYSFLSCYISLEISKDGIQLVKKKGIPLIKLLGSLRSYTTFFIKSFEVTQNHESRLKIVRSTSIPTALTKSRILLHCAALIMFL